MQSRCFYLAAVAVSSLCTLTGSITPAHAFSLHHQSENLTETTLASSTPSTSAPAPEAPSETASEPTNQRYPRKNDYTQLTQALDNFNFFSDGIASTVDEYIGFTGFVISDDNVSSSVLDSLNSALGAEGNQSSGAGFTSLKDGIGKTQAAANKANAAQQPDATGSRDAIAGPSYEQLKEMKGADEPPPLLLVLGTSFASIFLVSRIVS